MRFVLVAALVALSAPAMAQTWNTETIGGVKVWRPTPPTPEPPRPIIVQEAPPPPPVVVIDNSAPLYSSPTVFPPPIIHRPHRRH